MLEIQERRNQLKKECRSCCCAFFSHGKGAELEFLDDVIEHYNRVDAKDIKATIIFILDTTDAEKNHKYFGNETKQLINKLGKLNIPLANIQNDTAPLLKK